MTLPDTIKDKREKLGYTQELLAEKIGVSKQAVQKWESGKSKPSTQNIIAIEKALDIDCTELTSQQTPNDKIDKTKVLGSLIMCLAMLPFCISIIAYIFLPTTIPAHYDRNGVINRWGQSYEYVILGIELSLISVLMFLMLSKALLKFHFKKNEKVIVYLVLMLMPLAYSIMQVVFTVKAIENTYIVNDYSIINLSCVCLCTLLTLLSVWLPNVKQNAIFGFRISTTLSNADNWKKTHKVGGITLYIGAIIGAIISALSINYYAMLSFVPVTIGIFIPIIYSVKIAKTTNKV